MNQGQESPSLNVSSQIFFVIFFGAILASVALTFYTMYVRHDYIAFTEENEPEALDAYAQGYEWLTGVEPEEPEEPIE